MGHAAIVGGSGRFRLAMQVGSSEILPDRHVTTIIQACLPVATSLWSRQTRFSREPPACFIKKRLPGASEDVQRRVRSRLMTQRHDRYRMAALQKDRNATATYEVGKCEGTLFIGSTASIKDAKRTTSSARFAREEACAKVEELNAMQMHGASWAKQYHNKGFAIREAAVGNGLRDSPATEATRQVRCQDDAQAELPRHMGFDHGGRVPTCRVHRRARASLSVRARLRHAPHLRTISSGGARVRLDLTQLHENGGSGSGVGGGGCGGASGRPARQRLLPRWLLCSRLVGSSRRFDHSRQ